MGEAERKFTAERPFVNVLLSALHLVPLITAKGAGGQPEGRPPAWMDVSADRCAKPRLGLGAAGETTRRHKLTTDRGDARRRTRQHLHSTGRVVLAGDADVQVGQRGPA